MPDSGITNMPPGSKDPASVASERSGTRRAARIERLSAELREVRTPRKVRGQVVRDYEDGKVRLRLPEGEIEVRIEPQARLPNLRAGQVVEVDIPAGRPPEKVHVRPVAAQASASPSYQASETPVLLDVAGNVRPLPETPVYAGEPLHRESQALPEILPGQSFRMLPLPEVQVSLAPPLTQEAAFVSSMNVAEFTFKVSADVSGNAAVINTGQPLPKPLEALLQIPESYALPSLSAATSGAPEAGTAQIPSPAQVLMQPEAFAPETSLGRTGAADISFSPKRPVAIDVKILDVKLPEISLAVLGIPPETAIPPGRGGDIPSPEVAITDGASASSVIKAVIIGATPEQLPVVYMTWPHPGPDSSQVFVLQSPVEQIVPGMRLELLPWPREAKGGESSLQPPQAAAPLMLSQIMQPAPWPVMEELAQAVSRQSPQVVQVFAQVMPNVSSPAQLVPAVMFFLAAVRSGDVASWLGERTVDALRRGGKGPLLSRLNGEIARAGRAGAEALQNDWKGMAVPLAFQGEIHKAAFYYRYGDGGGRDGEDRDGKPTRFIFDLSLSRMGDVQIDGLLWGRRLDLALRTRQSFSSAMQQEIRRLYAGAISESGFEGEIMFQDDPARWVKVISEDKVMTFDS